MTVSLAGCGGDASTTAEAVSLVDVTTEQGISLKLPSDLAKQDSGAYVNMETGDSATFGVTEVAGYPLSGWKVENVLATYSVNYKDVVVTSFENGIQINGKEALVSQPHTTEVQELHNLFIQAVELRKDAYAQLFEVLTQPATDSKVDAAFATLDESDAKFEEFLTKGESMK